MDPEVAMLFIKILIGVLGTYGFLIVSKPLTLWRKFRKRSQLDESFERSLRSSDF